MKSSVPQVNSNRSSSMPRWLLLVVVAVVAANLLAGLASAQNRLLSPFARKAPHLDGAPGWGLSNVSPSLASSKIATR